MSKTVADLFDYFGDESTTETKKFVLILDKLFDCLNVRDLHQWVHKLKPDLKPYQSVDDPRLKINYIHVYTELLHKVSHLQGRIQGGS